MAGHGEEKTEQATPHKRKEARKKGQVAKSMEINAAVGLLAGILALKFFGPAFVNHWRAFATDFFTRAGTFHATVPAMQEQFVTAGSGLLVMVLPFVVVSMAAGLASNLLQTGFVFSGQALAFDFSRLNPLQGLKRMVSMRSMVELLKSSLKAGIILYFIATFFRDRGDEVLQLLGADYSLLGPTLVQLCWDLLVKTSAVLGGIALADYLFQRWQFEKDLRMTKQDIKEEYKRLEGDPQIKGRLRQRQREMARMRMMSDLASATVVVTNPTHYAVALRYTPGVTAAPLVVAKGQRLVALQIKERARALGIPIVENKPLARGLFALCDIGETIPADMYQAVAEVIAFVFKQSRRMPGEGGR